MLPRIATAVTIFAAAALSSIPAQAAYTFDFDDIVVVKASDVGMKFTVDYATRANNSHTSQLSALGAFTYKGVTNSGRTYNFDYAITNDSPADSRIRSFGFDTSGSVSSLNSLGAFTYEYRNVSYPENVATLDVCFAAGSGCTQHGSGGVADGMTGAGSFAITFANVMNSISLDHFALKFLGASSSAANGQDWGVGLGSIQSITMPGGAVSAAPEPTAWGMMLIGFGLVGYVLRGRRQRRMRFQIV